MSEYTAEKDVPMKRGRTEVETAALNGWDVGTVLRGHERWGSGEGVWTTIIITALGESTLLAHCIRHERTDADGVVTSDIECYDREASWTLRHREWTRPLPPEGTDS